MTRLELIGFCLVQQIQLNGQVDKNYLKMIGKFTDEQLLNENRRLGRLLY